MILSVQQFRDLETVIYYLSFCYLILMITQSPTEENEGFFVLIQYYLVRSQRTESERGFSACINSTNIYSISMLCSLYWLTLGEISNKSKNSVPYEPYNLKEEPSSLPLLDQSPYRFNCTHIRHYWEC